MYAESYPLIVIGSDSKELNSEAQNLKPLHFQWKQEQDFWVFNLIYYANTGLEASLSKKYHYL